MLKIFLHFPPFMQTLLNAEFAQFLRLSVGNMLRTNESAVPQTRSEFILQVLIKLASAKTEHDYLSKILHPIATERINFSAFASSAEKRKNDLSFLNSSCEVTKK